MKRFLFCTFATLALLVGAVAVTSTAEGSDEFLASDEYVSDDGSGQDGQVAQDKKKGGKKGMKGKKGKGKGKGMKGKGKGKGKGKKKADTEEVIQTTPELQAAAAVTEQPEAYAPAAFSRRVGGVMAALNRERPCGWLVDRHTARPATVRV
jgi:hypothetical protein